MVRSLDYKGIIERPFLHQHFGLFLGTVRQVLNRCLFLADSLQKFDNILGAIFFAYYSCISSVQLFLPRIALNAMIAQQHLFQANVPSINLVSKQIYHRIGGILRESSKYGEAWRISEAVEAGSSIFLSEGSLHGLHGTRIFLTLSQEDPSTRKILAPCKKYNPLHVNRVQKTYDARMIPRLPESSSLHVNSPSVSRKKGLNNDNAIQYNTIQYLIQGIETKVTKYLSKGDI